jgi:hypothetical protein
MTAYVLVNRARGFCEIIKTFTNMNEGLEYSQSISQFIEEDRDHLGHFDMFTKGGMVYSLEPAKG